MDIQKSSSYALSAAENAQVEQRRDLLGEALRILGSIQAVDENYVAASELYNRALNVFKELNDSTGIANCYISLGHTFRRQKK